MCDNKNILLPGNDWDDAKDGSKVRAAFPSTPDPVAPGPPAGPPDDPVAPGPPAGPRADPAPIEGAPSSGGGDGDSATAGKVTGRKPRSAISSSRKPMSAPKSAYSDEEQSEGWEIDFEQFPDHLKFLNKLRNAQRNANESGKRAQLCWRGHRTSIGPKSGDGIMTRKEFLQRLICALRNIKSVKKEEKKVKF